MIYSFARTPLQQERLASIGGLAVSFKEGALEADRRNEFSYEHIKGLQQLGYPSWTAPKEYGGEEISLYEFVLYQERLAMGDAAIALGIGWHAGVLHDLAEKRPWPEPVFAEMCRDIVNRGALINRAATEAATGSPSRGGMPGTTATRLPGGGFRLNGRKTFTTLAPVLDYFIVTAVQQPDGEHVEFLIPRATPGLHIEETWDMCGMRGTASHDLVLEDVEVPQESLVHVHAKIRPQSSHPYLLHIPACYLGIAMAAKEEALQFSRTYQPNSLQHPILQLPHIEQSFGRIELELSAARHFLYAVAQRWDEEPERRDQLAADLGAVKVIAVQTALSVVDKAMRISGAHGLVMSNPLQKLYRDVRFGLHNPPMEDQVIRQLSSRAISEKE